MIPAPGRDTGPGVAESDAGNPIGFKDRSL